MKIGVKPTIFVGLGGTGYRVLSNVRRRLIQRCGTADLPFFRWIYIDTQPDNLEAAKSGLRGKKAMWTATCEMRPSPETISRLHDATLDGGATKQELDIDAWFDAGALAGLSNVEWELGVGGRRMYGRLGFLAGQNLGTLAGTLSTYRDQLTLCPDMAGKPLEDVDPPYMRIVPDTVLPGIDFVVVSSGGGGTGSGCFIDLGLLLRQMSVRAGWAGVNQYGYALMARPGMGTQNHARNSAALLLELDHYRPGSGAMYEAGYLNLAYRTQIIDPPYDMSFVVQPCHQDVPLADEATAAFTELEWLVAEDIVNHALAIWDNDVPSTEVNVPLAANRVAFSGDMGQNPRGLESFGIKAVEFPAGLVHRYLYGATIRHIAEGWSEVDEQKHDEAVEDLRELLGLPDAATAANAAPRNPQADRLKDALLEDCQGIRVVAQLEQARAKAPTAEELRQRKRATPQDCLEIVEQTKRAFQQRHGPPVPGDPGTVYATVMTNAEQLQSLDDERSLKGLVATTILDLAVSLPGGPATARDVASTVSAMTAAEVSFIEQCLAAVEADAPTKPTSLYECWEYANNSLLRLVLSHKRAILQDLTSWLHELCKRMRHFTEYIQNWAESALGREDLDVAEDCPVIILPDRVVRDLENSALSAAHVVDLTAMDAPEPPGGGSQAGLVCQLRDLAGAGFPAVSATDNEPTLFADGSPMDKGRIDFRPMAVFERAVFESIERGAASPYNVEVLDLLETEYSAARIDPPNFAQASEILLNYNRTHADYAKLYFNGTPTHLLEQVQPNQSGFAWYQPAQQPTWPQQWPGHPDTTKRIPLHGTVPRLNSQVVVHEALRCSILWEYVLGYDRESAATLFRSGEHPALSDKRIQLPPPPSDLRGAQMLLFGSVVLRLWTYLGGDQPYHRFQYTWIDAQGGQHKGNFFAHHAFGIGANELALNRDVMEAVDLAVRDYVQKNAGPAADAVQEAANLLDERMRPADVPDSAEIEGDILEYNLRAVNYALAMSALNWFASRFDIPRPEVRHPYATFEKKGAPVLADQVASQDGYYCTRCGYNFGINMPPYRGRCPEPTCGNPYGPVADDQPPREDTRIPTW